MTASVRDPHALIVAAFLAAAMILGGGGWPNPATEIILEFVAFGAAVAWLWLGRTSQVRHPVGAGPWLLAAACVIVPLFQLIPLPPGAWHALPGQEVRMASLSLVGATDEWRPLTLSPSRTLAGLLSVIPAVLAMIGVASLDSRGRLAVVRTIAGIAVVAALLGAVQLSLGESGPHLYAASNVGVTGFQANKNAAADVLLIGLLATAVVLQPSLLPRSGSREATSAVRLVSDPKAAWVIMGALALLFCAAAIFTNSRAGIALIPVALAATWIIVAPALPSARARWLPPVLLLAATAVAFALMTLSTNTALHAIFARFEATDDFRRELWEDATFALRGSWPAGIGLGGAQNALVAAERLEIIDPSAPNRVHNDYLEFLLEGGILAAGAMIAGAFVLLRTAWLAIRREADMRTLTGFGLAVITLLALHSFVDYPMRSMALACLIGTGAGLLFPARGLSGRASVAGGQRVIGSAQ